MNDITSFRRSVGFKSCAVRSPTFLGWRPSSRSRCRSSLRLWWSWASLTPNGRPRSCWCRTSWSRRGPGSRPGPFSASRSQRFAEGRGIGIPALARWFSWRRLSLLLGTRRRSSCPRSPRSTPRIPSYRFGTYSSPNTRRLGAAFPAASHTQTSSAAGCRP